jgi:uncharacterized membrane protein YcaP (DUF421 family)
MKEFLHNDYVMIVLRCIAVYIFVVIAIRIFGKKELAQLSVVDLVFILLISNAVQNAMVGPDTSLEGGLIAALALFIVNYLLKQLLYRNKKISEILQGKSLMLIYDGQLQEHNLQKAEITLEELTAAVREHGVEDLEHVDLAVLEVDGNISVISNDFKKKSVHPVAAMGFRRKHKFKGRIN